MKRTIALTLLITIALTFCSCNNSEYVPAIIVEPPFSLMDDIIYGNLVNVYYIEPYKIIRAVEDDVFVTMYEDDSYSKHFSGDNLEVTDGKKTYYLLIGTSEKVKAYKLIIECTLILDFEISINEDITYSIGDSFDRTSITVYATKEDGSIIETQDYNVEFDSSSLGSKQVIIEYGGIVHDFYVNIVDT
ncbi:MAG: bacterial Ig-like domain-containing protein [Clostridia bacterium]|nr:bacterial Ig-like domain-containing protein [Clostridia bacterium]